MSTGASEDFKVYNIYDFAGNMAEWTTEYGTKAEIDDSEAQIPEVGKDFFEWAPNAVCRGGSYYYDDPTISSKAAIANGWAVEISFRVVLYLKS